MHSLTPEWASRYDSAAPRHASSLSHNVSCGMVSNRLHTARKDDCCDAFSVSWFLSGSGAWEENGQKSNLHPGCLLLRRPGRQGTLTLGAHTVHRRCFLRVDGSLYPLLLRLLPELDSLPSVCIKPYNVLLLERFQGFVDFVRGSDESSSLPFLSEMRALLCEFFTLRDGREDDPILRAAMLLTTLPPSTPLPDIAEQCGIPYGQFRKWFTQVYGVAPGQWRIIQRILKAQQALASGEAIQKVAERLEYADVYTFTHQFRNVTGITPKNYQLSRID